MPFTTYNRIAEQCERLLGIHSDDSMLFRQELIIAVKQAHSKLALQRISMLQAQDVADVDGSLIFSFKNVEVEYDADLDQYYAVMPTTTAWLPYGMGIQQVSPMKNTRQAYIPVSNSFSSLYEGLSSQGLQNKIGYYLENNRVYLENVDAINNPSKLFIKVVAPFDVDDEQEMNVPSDMQFDIVTTVVALYSQRKPEDTTNDNNDQV